MRYAHRQKQLFLTNLYTIRNCLTGAVSTFLIMVLVCIMIFPQVFEHANYGISHFGTEHTTLLPYYFGFSLTIMFTLLLAFKIKNQRPQLSTRFMLIAMFMSGTAATSYYFNHTVYITHWVFSILLMLTIVATALLQLTRNNYTGVDRFILYLLVADIIVSLYPGINQIAGLKYFIPRETLMFMCSFWLMGRAVLNPNPKNIEL